MSWTTSRGDWQDRGAKGLSRVQEPSSEFQFAPLITSKLALIADENDKLRASGREIKKSCQNNLDDQKQIESNLYSNVAFNLHAKMF